MDGRPQWGLSAQRAVLLVAGGALATLLLLPLTALLLSSAPDELVAGLGAPFIGTALRLSVFSTAVTLAIAVSLGTPLAWTLSQAQGRTARLLESLLQLPVVIPPAVAGVALLLAFGHRGLVASLVGPEWGALSFTTAAVVLAQLFVAAPLFVQGALAAFRALDPEVVLAARALGAGPVRVLLRVAVPMAAPGLIAGAALCWARALGEFGATLLFAGNLEGRTQTLPLAIYTAMEVDLRAARALSVVLIGVALLLLLGVRLATARRPGNAERA